MKKELLIDFLIYLSEKGKITDYDFVFEQAEKFLKAREKQKAKRKKIDEMISGKPLSFDELLMFQRNQLQRLQEIYSTFEIHGGDSHPEQYEVFNNGEKIAYIRYRHSQFTVDFRGQTILMLEYEGDEGIMDPIQRIECLTKALEAIKSKL